MARAGRPLPAVDGLLAATALQHDLTLLTRSPERVTRGAGTLVRRYHFPSAGHRPTPDAGDVIFVKGVTVEATETAAVFLKSRSEYSLIRAKYAPFMPTVVRS